VAGGVQADDVVSRGWVRWTDTCALIETSHVSPRLFAGVTVDVSKSRRKVPREVAGHHCGNGAGPPVAVSTVTFNSIPSK
jgi:hypothetical protein